MALYPPFKPDTSLSSIAEMRVYCACILLPLTCMCMNWPGLPGHGPRLTLWCLQVPPT